MSAGEKRRLGQPRIARRGPAPGGVPSPRGAGTGGPASAGVAGPEPTP